MNPSPDPVAANRQELDSYREQLLNVAADHVGDVQMLILAAADKLGMASDLMEAEQQNV